MERGGTRMKHAWKSRPKRWHHVMRVVAFAALLCCSACAASGRSVSTPSAPSPQTGSAGTGTGGGSY